MVSRSAFELVAATALPLAPNSMTTACCRTSRPTRAGWRRAQRARRHHQQGLAAPPFGAQLRATDFPSIAVQYYGQGYQILARIMVSMPKASSPPLPTVQRALRQFGANVRLARLRRGFSAELLAERAGMSRTTLRAIERGSANVTLGACANVMHCLGLAAEIGQLASTDELGRKLQDAGLEARVRAPRRPRKGSAPTRTPEAT